MLFITIHISSNEKVFYLLRLNNSVKRPMDLNHHR